MVDIMNFQMTVQAAQARVSTPGGQATQATVSYPNPFLFREKWLMVDIMNIQMTVQEESLLSDKLSFWMESVRFSGIGTSFLGSQLPPIG